MKFFLQFLPLLFDGILGQNVECDGGCREDPVENVRCFGDAALRDCHASFQNLSKFQF